jgi:hypothetical protein
MRDIMYMADPAQLHTVQITRGTKFFTGLFKAIYIISLGTAVAGAGGLSLEHIIGQDISGLAKDVLDYSGSAVMGGALMALYFGGLYQSLKGINKYTKELDSYTKN